MPGHDTYGKEGLSLDRDRIPRRLAAALVLMGFVATSAQVLLIRRLMSSLYGNELVVGVALALWMVGTALGSLLAAGVSESRSKTFLAGISIAAMVLLPATVLGTYGIKAAFGMHAAQALGPGRSLLACTALLFPLTALLGSAFVFFSIADRSEREERIGAVYLLEALGAALGGAACGLAASIGLPPFEWSFAVMCGVGLMVWLSAPAGVWWRISSALLLIAAAALIWGPARTLPRAAKSLAWPGYKLIEAVESRYASIVVAEGGGQRTLFVDALPDFTVPDISGAEEVIHTALLQHPHPKRVLLIGGGVTAAAREAFKHGLERLDYVQLDPMITQVEREHLSGGLAQVFADPRVSVHNVDGRFFLATARGPVYDAIIVNLPDPATVLINRFYTVEFFKMAKSLLEPEAGVLAFGCGEVANYVSRSQGRLLACQAQTLAAAFEHQVVLPLSRVYFVASEAAGALAADGREMAKRLEARGIETAFMRDYYLGYDLSKERVTYLRSEIERALETERPQVNRDRNPVGYFYYLIHWYRLLGSPLADVMESPWVRRGSLACLLAAAVGMIGIVLAGRLSERRAPVSLGVFAMGFATLTSQVVLLLAFQTFQGYLFHRVGLIVAAFMVGLSLGALWLRRRPASVRLWPIQTALAIYCGILALALRLPLERIPEGPSTALAVAASMAGGLLGGALFQAAAAAIGQCSVRSGPNASRGVLGSSAAGVPAGAGAGGGNAGTSVADVRSAPYGAGPDSLGRTVASSAALLNACDHLGAALGALAAASVLLPALGLAGTAGLAAAAAGGSALGLVIYRI